MKSNKPTENRGRKSIILPTLKKNVLAFLTNTDMELAVKFLPLVQEKMKGGLSTDPTIIKKQITSLHMGIYKFRQKGIAEGKKIAFKGRKVNGVVRTKWLKSGRHKLGAEAPKTPPIL